MSPSPIANRSFLHGDRKSFPAPGKMVYATLDSLALKRARLPLQLLPVDDKSCDINEKSELMDVASTAFTDLKVDASNVVEIVSNPKFEPLGTILEQKIQNDMVLDESTDCEMEVAGTKVGLEELHDYGKIAFSVCNELNSTDYETVELMNPQRSVDVCSDGNRKRTDIVETSAGSNLTLIKSKSTTDLPGNTCFFTAVAKPSDKMESIQRRLNEKTTVVKKKSQFAKNVLEFVPGHLGKSRRPKRNPKKKLGTCNLSSSLGSLNSSAAVESCGRLSKNFSKVELRNAIISSPTNFVHLASATKPDLLSKKTGGPSNPEQVIITHEEKRATLPLLVQRNQTPDCRTNRQDQSEDTACFSDGSPFIEIQTAAASTRKNVDDLSLVSSGMIETCIAKVSKQSQQVEIHALGKNQANAKNEKFHDSTCDGDSREFPPDLHVNSSFLWNTRAKRLTNVNKTMAFQIVTKEDEEDIDLEEYDDVAPQNSLLQYDYDDVGSPVTCHSSENSIGSNGDPLPNHSEGIYDDVLALVTEKSRLPNNPAEESDYSMRTLNEARSTATDAEESNGNQGDHYHSINNEYSSIEEKEQRGLNTDDFKSNRREMSARTEETVKIMEDEQDVYDDVGLPCEERVNSLYAGSAAGSIAGSAADSILGLTNLTNAKEREWEDLEDPADLKNNPRKQVELQSVQSEKLDDQKAPRKPRRQRSRRSGKEVVPLSRTTCDSSASCVALSLGGGSVLLVGNSEKIEGEWRRQDSPVQCETEDPHLQRTQGLVQIRLVDLDEDTDTQESSCYVHEENASDDSNYESLYSFHPDEFSSDSETEVIEDSSRRCESAMEKVGNEYHEAPTRPVPPPPRGASLTRTLGRRIRLLRRTWSITKGSLGRMRRKHSAEEYRSCEENSDHPSTETGKYFSQFARHFRKSVTGLSTFYLDGNVNSELNSQPRSVNQSRLGNEPVYSNTQWYREPQNVPEKILLSSSCSNRDFDGYSVLAIQEPLYQFYAAAAAKMAFDSDSDGYEEVENIQSRTATDLAKPGHRTLWCQTPQVANAGLLQGLAAEERKIQEAKFEILTSEASYLNSLRVLENEFLKDPVLTEEILSKNEYDRLFGAIPSVLSASEKFLAELETLWREDPMLKALPGVLLKCTDEWLDVYVAYCSNQVSIDVTLKELRRRKGPKFLEAISRIEAQPACKSLSLHSFLMLPMQRVTRLPLLADAILSKLSMEHPDRSEWEGVLSSLSYVVAECNEAARTAAQDAEIEALAGKLEYSGKIKPVVLKGKHIVRSGSVVQLLTKADAEYKLTFGKKFNKIPLYLLLLTDYLLVAKLKTNTQDEIYTVIDICKRSLVALESVSEESPFAGRNAMILTLLENHCGRQVEYILTCESNTERQRWLEAVLPSERGLVGETLYESWDCPQIVALYSYTPNQPDELALQPGDVINVLRKMGDGWYHGEKLLDGEQGWFPGNYTKEVASEHVRARNLKQRHRLLALSGSVLQRKAKQQTVIY